MAGSKRSGSVETMGFSWKRGSGALSNRPDTSGWRPECRAQTPGERESRSPKEMLEAPVPGPQHIHTLFGENGGGLLVGQAASGNHNHQRLLPLLKFLCVRQEQPLCALTKEISWRFWKSQGWCSHLAVMIVAFLVLGGWIYWILCLCLESFVCQIA